MAIIHKLDDTRYEIIPDDPEESLSARDVADLLVDDGRIPAGSLVTWIGGHLYDVQEDTATASAFLHAMGIRRHPAPPRVVVLSVRPRFCHDPRHLVPCPLPCPGCDAECEQEG